MDDFDYSVHISEQDWDSFFLECEECDLSQPELAGLDDSCLSDVDEPVLEPPSSGWGAQAQLQPFSLETELPHFSIFSPVDFSGSPLELAHPYLSSRYDTGALEDVLSGSEEEVDLESVNRFMEKLKTLAGGEQPSVHSKACLGTQVGLTDASCPETARETWLQGGACVSPGKISTGTEREALLTMWSGSVFLQDNSTDRKEPAQTDVSRKHTGRATVQCGDVHGLFSELGICKQVTASSKHGDERNEQSGEDSGFSDTPREYTVQEEKWTTGLTRSEFLVTVQEVQDTPESLLKDGPAGKAFGSLSTCSKVVCGTIDGEMQEQQYCVRQTVIESAEETIISAREMAEIAGDQPTEGKGAMLCVLDQDSPRGSEELPGQEISGKSPSKRQGTGSLSMDYCQAGTKEDFSNSLKEHPNPTGIPAVSGDGECSSATGMVQELASQPAASVSAGTADQGGWEAPNVLKQEIAKERVNLHQQTSPRDFALAGRESASECCSSAVLPVPAWSPLTDYSSGCKDQRHPTEAEQSLRESLATLQHEDVSSLWQMENGHGGSAHAEDGKTERHLAYLCIDNADEACVSTETRESESLHPTALNVQPDSPLDTVTIVRVGSGVVAVADPLGQLKSLYNTVSGCTVSAIDEPHNTAPVLPSSSEVAEESSAHLATSDSSYAMSGHSAARLPTPEQESRTECHTDQSLLLISEETAPAESCDLFGAAVLRDSAWPQNTPAVADNNTQKDSLLQLEFRTEGLPPGDSLPTGDPHQDQAQQIVLERCVPDELEHSHDAMACALVTNSESKSKALDCMQPLNAPQVHVISDFWEEMEKLTINDILYIKLMDSGQQPQGPFLHDATMTDVSDTSDSGYFTHLEDSPDKPDLSSGNDISMFSDFEEFSQTQDSSTDPTLEPQDTPVQTSMQELSYHKGEVWEGESGEIPSISRSEAPCFPGSTRTKGIKKIYKNVSVQDLRALETEPEQRLVSRCVSLQTRLSEAEESCSSFGDPLNPDVDHVHIGGESESSSRSEIPPQPYFSPAAATESYMISVPEIFEYLFDVQGATGSGVSFANEDVSKKSIPEMYDYFFSEFETESFFFPIIQGSESDQNEPIPIFSSSSCSDKVLPVPEVYDSFFEGVPEAGVEDQEDSGPIRVVTRVDHCTSTPSAVSGPDAYEHFFTDRDLDQSFFWRNLMSLRGRRFLRRTEGTGDGHQSSSSAAEDGKKGSVCRKKGPAKGWEKRDDDCPPMALSFLKEQILRHLEEQGKRGTDSRTALAMPRKESFLLSVNQSDMCLVCIAFASWVLKSSNPQAADAWKAALLANVSAISAIRYLRRYVKKGKPADVP